MCEKRKMFKKLIYFSRFKKMQVLFNESVLGIAKILYRVVLRLYSEKTYFLCTVERWGASHEWRRNGGKEISCNRKRISWRKEYDMMHSFEDFFHFPFLHLFSRPIFLSFFYVFFLTYFTFFTFSSYSSKCRSDVVGWETDLLVAFYLLSIRRLHVFQKMQS